MPTDTALTCFNTPRPGSRRKDEAPSPAP
jgi:hypothetical protein